MRINGETQDWLVHRLIAKTWTPNPNKYPIINHKDNNPLNNSVDNLEWCTQSYNIRYAGIQGRRPYTERMRIARSMPKKSLWKSIAQYSLDGKYIISFGSSTLAAKAIDPKHWKSVQGNILACCKGHHKTSYGYIWKYDKDFIIE